MKELEPYVEEYQQLRRVAEAMEESRSTTARPAPRRTLKRSGPGRAGNTARATEAKQLIERRPGMTVAELSKEMGIGTTYLYRLLPRLEREGALRKEGKGYHPV
jgi:hypothetical protein